MFLKKKYNKATVRKKNCKKNYKKKFKKKFKKKLKIKKKIKKNLGPKIFLVSKKK